MYSADGETPVGQIRKQWSGVVKEFFTDADNFGITFPMDLGVNIKATLIAVCFLIVSIRYIKVTLFKLSLEIMIVNSMYFQIYEQRKLSHLRSNKDFPSKLVIVQGLIFPLMEITILGRQSL